MGDRYYRQIGQAKGLKSVKEIMDYCNNPPKAESKLTKKDLAKNIGVPEVEKLKKEDLVWLSENIDQIELDESVEFSSKKAIVTILLEKYPKVDWNAMTFVGLKKLFGVI
jgi:hypothetical protein